MSPRTLSIIIIVMTITFIYSTIAWTGYKGQKSTVNAFTEYNNAMDEVLKEVRR